MDCLYLTYWTHFWSKGTWSLGYYTLIFTTYDVLWAGRYLTDWTYICPTSTLILNFLYILNRLLLMLPRPRGSSLTHKHSPGRRVLGLELSINSHRLLLMLLKPYRMSTSYVFNSFLVKGSSKVFKQEKLLDSFWCYLSYR